METRCGKTSRQRLAQWYRSEISNYSLVHFVGGQECFSVWERFKQITVDCCDHRERPIKSSIRVLNDILCAF